ncbi:MAG: phosphotransferase [Pseudomonadota bacterium]
MSQRIEQIKNWLEQQGTTIKSFEVASNDASFRAYFRVVFSASDNVDLVAEKSYIVMDAPPEFEDVKPFIRIANFLESFGLNIPHIYAINEPDGFLLLGDLGRENFLDNLNKDNANALYQQAMLALIKLQSVPEQQWLDLPDYNAQLLNQEMDLFNQWYIKIHKKQVLTHSQQQVLQQTLAYLTEQILLQPKVIVHRDYHSRNLMLVENNNPGIIDFQDAVIGPCSYDLVSLLRDSYICWPEQQVEQWVAYFHQQLLAQGIIKNCSFNTFMQWFDFMGMQRQIKVAGIFSRLYHRDGKENYLKDIPQTLAYLTKAAAKYPQFKEFHALLLSLQGTSEIPCFTDP